MADQHQSLSSYAGKRICLAPRLSGVGGMVSFQHKLAAGLTKRGVQVTFDLADFPYQAVLVIGGTRQLSGLARARRKGARLVQRLDGMNWLHRVRPTGDRLRVSPRQFIHSEYGNWLLSTIRSRLAERVVYQSEFSRRWWERVRGPTIVPSVVIYNGVDLLVYSPEGPGERPDDRLRILLVEGSLMGGYESGLETAARLVEILQTEHRSNLDRPVELMIAGRVPESLQEKWMQKSGNINFAGLIPGEMIPQLDRSAHLLYSADLNAACPNSVIEAMACGLPVVSFDTGALPELVTPEAGKISPYGGDPWRLDPPAVELLAEAALAILTDPAMYRLGSRRRAEEAFGLDAMVDQYLEVLLD